MFVNRGDIGCCGVREIEGLASVRTPAKALKLFGEQVYAHLTAEEDEHIADESRFRYVFFTQAGKRMYGTKFAAFIRQHQLGDVIETGTHLNPNSGNPLKMWVWTVDHDAVKKHLKVKENVDGKTSQLPAGPPVYVVR